MRWARRYAGFFEIWQSVPLPLGDFRLLRFYRKYILFVTICNSIWNTFSLNHLEAKVTWSKINFFWYPRVSVQLNEIYQHRIVPQKFKKWRTLLYKSLQIRKMRKSGVWKFGQGVQKNGQQFADVLYGRWPWKGSYLFARRVRRLWHQHRWSRMLRVPYTRALSTSCTCSGSAETPW